MNQIHEAVDLAAAAGDCVFAAYSGRVAAVESNPAETAGNVIIDHHSQGRGFLTEYDHITDITVTPGAFVQKGMPFAAISAEPTEPHGSTKRRVAWKPAIRRRDCAASRHKRKLARRHPRGRRVVGPRAGYWTP